MKICNNISCMKQILSTHNPKVVSSNLAPATTQKARVFGMKSEIRAFVF